MKIGILGGGQLGRMFLQVATNYPAEFYILDPDANAPSRPLTAHFTKGDFRDKETVLHFAQNLDAVGIEIEQVNLEAVEILEQQGKRVIPSASALKIIQDKGLQKQFYANHNIPTAPFYLYAPEEALPTEFPFVQKTRTGGYDGKGVQIIKNEAELSAFWAVPSVIEQVCAIKKEIAVFIACDDVGNLAVYPVFEMVFDDALNLVDFVQMPAYLAPELSEKAQNIAKKVVEALGSAGVFAVELFVSEDDEIWVNETACRVHNSAHITIEASASSQFDQMFRVLAGLPLGDTTSRPASMLNIVGKSASDLNLSALLAEPSVFVHWYGKNEVRAGRKMGHITIVADTPEALLKQTQKIKKIIE